MNEFSGELTFIVIIILWLGKLGKSLALRKRHLRLKRKA